MSCQLRFSAEGLDVDAALSTLTFQPHTINRPGDYVQNPVETFIIEYPGFTVTVSEAEFDDFEGQLADVTAFITEHKPSLLTLSQVEARVSFYFDFGLESRLFDEDVWSDSIRFPYKLLLLLAEIEADLEISYYHPTPDEGEDDEEDED